MSTGDENTCPLLGVVIPVYHAGDQLSALLDQLKRCDLPTQVVVVQGGTADMSTASDSERDVFVIRSDRHGRGHQLRLGIAHLNTPWYLILHADSRLTGDWQQAVQRFITNVVHKDKAGYFDFQLNIDSRKARLLEQLVQWRCRVFGLPYGDQGLLIPRQLLELCGGVPDLPLMEDVQLARKLTRRRLKRIGVPLLTSARHYLEHGFVRRSAQNVLFLLLFYVGVKPVTLYRWYYRK